MKGLSVEGREIFVPSRYLCPTLWGFPDGRRPERNPASVGFPCATSRVFMVFKISI
jgi:hypothetical protein